MLLAVNCVCACVLHSMCSHVCMYTCVWIQLACRGQRLTPSVSFDRPPPCLLLTVFQCTQSLTTVFLIQFAQQVLHVLGHLPRPCSSNSAWQEAHVAAGPQQRERYPHTPEPEAAASGGSVHF